MIDTPAPPFDGGTLNKHHAQEIRQEYENDLMDEK